MGGRESGQPDLGEIRDILVLSMGEFLGDAVYKIPFVEALRLSYPHARIAWYAAGAGSAFSNVLAFYARGRIDEIIDDETAAPNRLSALFSSKQPFGRPFDLVIDTQMRALPTLVGRKAATRRFVSRSAGGLFSDVQPYTKGPLPVAEHMAELLQMATGRPTPLLLPRLSDDRAIQAAEALLPPGPCYVAIAPGAGGVSKRWPLERFIAVGRRLAQAGATPVFLIGPAEMEFAEPVMAAVPGAAIPELGRTDAYQDVKGPRLLLALAGRFDFALANDAGVGHVLGIGGAPMVTLFPSRRMARKFPPPGVKLAAFSGDDFGDQGVRSIPETVVGDVCLDIYRHRRGAAAS